MREVEVKAVVPDEEAARERLEAAGAQLVFAGRLEDRRYADPTRALVSRDQVLRLRIYRNQQMQKPMQMQEEGQKQIPMREGTVVHAQLDWKGPTEYHGGYKVRDEVTTPVGAPDALALILHRLGYVVIGEIDRVIAEYRLDDAVVRFERYPRMDILVEVEGPPAAIEGAIEALGLPRSSFSAARLPEFVAQFEARTQLRAALCDRELAGEYSSGVADA